MDNFAALLALFKTLLGVEQNDTSRDDELTAYLQGAITICETYIDDIIDRRAVTERWLRKQAPMTLRYREAAQLTAVTLEGEDVTAEWEILLGELYAELHRVDRCSFVFTDEEMVVSYTAGLATCPYDLMLAIRDVAAAIEAQSGAGAVVNGLPVKRESINGIGTVEYDTSGMRGNTAPIGMMTAKAIQLLDPYRRIGM